MSYLLAKINTINASGFYKASFIYMLLILLAIRTSIDYFGLSVTIPLPFFGDLSPSQLFGLGVIPLSLSFFIFHFKQIRHTPLLLPFLLIILFALVTVPLTPINNVMLTVYEVLRIVSIVFIYALSYLLITTKDHFKILVLFILAASCIPLLFVLFQLITGVNYTDTAFDSELRIFGSFMHPNVYGTYLIAIISTALISLNLTLTTRERLFTGIILSLNFIALLLTFSRISWLVSLLIISTVLIVKNRLLIIPFVLVLLLAYAAMPDISTRLHEAVTFTPDNSLVWRFNLWHDAILYTQSNDATLIGNGTGTFMDVADNVRGDLFGDHEPHNEFVRSYVENGIIGLMLYIFYLISFTIILALSTLKSPTIAGRNTFFILTVLFFGLIVASLTDHIFRSTPLQWIVMALIGGAFATFNKSAKESSSHASPKRL